MSTTRASSYGELHASVYDRIYRQRHTADAAVGALAELTGPGGRLLELGVGTGRLAIPVAGQGIAVDGIEGSPAMIEQLRAQPDGDLVGIVQADLADFDLGRSDYTAAVCAVSTLYMLPTRSDQQNCIRCVAKHLQPGGLLIIEAFQIDPTRFDTTGHREETRPTADGSRHHVRSTHDPERQSIHIEHTLTDTSAAITYQVTLHYLSTTQLDDLATEAGLTLHARWHDWTGFPAHPHSTDPISLYRTPIGPASDARAPSGR